MQKTPESAVFEPEFIAGVQHIWHESIAFNKVLGLELVRITPDKVEAKITMRPELIGHALHQRIHGGVISASLDAMGGLAVMASIGARHMDEPVPQRLARFRHLGTIDMRVDYLRPGIGEWFRLEAETLRLGSRVANTRMAFLAADGKLLSTGSAAYMVS